MGKCLYATALVLTCSRTGKEARYPQPFAFLVSRAEARMLRHAERGSPILQHTWSPGNQNPNQPLLENIFNVLVWSPSPQYASRYPQSHLLSPELCTRNTAPNGESCFPQEQNQFVQGGESHRFLNSNDDSGRNQPFLIYGRCRGQLLRKL